MKKGFDNAKYLQMQSQHIRERIAQFDNKTVRSSNFQKLYFICQPIYIFKEVFF